MNKKPLNTAGSDFRDPQSVKVPSTPFSSSWTNNRPLASMGLSESPAGKLSPKELAGVGKGK